MREHAKQAVSVAVPRDALARRVAAIVSLVTVLALGATNATAAGTAHHKARHPARTNHRKHHATRPTRLTGHGQLLSIAPRHANTNQSNNWFGYNQGTIEQGGKLFNSIGGQWTVPTATQHTSGQAEASSDWIGIGGGCVDANCLVGDPTLIQTGTEQDVSSSGQPSYSAWWEIIPGPSIAITKMTVHAGDHMTASIAELVPDSEMWKITLTDSTTGRTVTTTVPYTSTHATAEWIEETPLEIGTNAGFSALPNLTNPDFDHGSVNGATVKLKSSEEMQLIDSNGKVIGAPSAPDSDADGFSACTWAGTCTAPAS